MDTQAQLAFEMSQLQQRIDVLEARTFTIPVVDVDPSTDDPIQFWRFTDGRLRHRLVAGEATVVQYSPDDVIFDYVDAGPPALTADPGAGDDQKWWMNTATGQLRIRTTAAVRSFAPIASGSSSTTGGRPPSDDTSDVPKPTPPPPKKSYDKTLTAEWIACYDGDGDRRATSGRMFYGKVSNTWGRQKIMMGFENFRAQLVGADVRYAELIINSLHTYYYAGGRAFFGTHTAGGAPPLNFSRKSRDNFTQLLPDGDTIRFAVNEKFVGQLRDNVIDGFTVEQPDDSKGRYGYMDDVVKLRVKYVK